MYILNTYICVVNVKIKDEIVWKKKKKKNNDDDDNLHIVFSYSKDPRRRFVRKEKIKKKKTMQRKGCSGKNKRIEERFEEEENAFDWESR